MNDRKGGGGRDGGRINVPSEILSRVVRLAARDTSTSLTYLSPSGSHANRRLDDVAALRPLQALLSQRLGADGPRTGGPHDQHLRVGHKGAEPSAKSHPRPAEGVVAFPARFPGQLSFSLFFL